MPRLSLQQDVLCPFARKQNEAQFVMFTHHWWYGCLVSCAPEASYSSSSYIASIAITGKNTSF